MPFVSAESTLSSSGVMTTKPFRPSCRLERDSLIAASNMLYRSTSCIKTWVVG